MKKLIMSRKQYNDIKSIIDASTCMAVAYDKVIETFKVNYELAVKMTNSVMYNYKYLQVIE